MADYTVCCCRADRLVIILCIVGIMLECLNAGVQLAVEMNSNDHEASASRVIRYGGSSASLFILVVYAVLIVAALLRITCLFTVAIILQVIELLIHIGLLMLVIVSFVQVLSEITDEHKHRSVYMIYVRSGVVYTLMIFFDLFLLHVLCQARRLSDALNRAGH